MSRTLRAFLMLMMVVALVAPAGARPKKKHAAPKPRDVVVMHEGVRYVAAHRLVASGEKATNAAYVEAWDAKNKKKLWEVLLYENESGESDDALMTSMKVEGEKIVVRNRRKETFEIDLESHAVTHSQ
jgi:hypothetical protein